MYKTNYLNIFSNKVFREKFISIIKKRLNIGTNIGKINNIRLNKTVIEDDTCYYLEASIIDTDEHCSREVRLLCVTEKSIVIIPQSFLRNISIAPIGSFINSKSFIRMLKINKVVNA